VTPPVAPTLSLAVDDDLQAVVATVNVPAGAVALFLSRTGPSGTVAYVRGDNPLTVTGGAVVIVRDFEAPIGVPLTYTATVANDVGEQSPPATHTITVPSSGCEDTWITDIAAPTNTQRLPIEQLNELDYEAASGIHNVLNRRTPIVTSDIARAPKFELSVLTDTDTQREKTRAALGNGVPILLRTPPEYGLGSMYLSITEWKEQRIVNSADLPARRFVMSCVQVDRPDPVLYVPVFIATYAGIRDAYTDYAALKAARDTYDDVLHDPAAAAALNVVPWPPDDV
jgi:hypothetical protein